MEPQSPGGQDDGVGKDQAQCQGPDSPSGATLYQPAEKPGGQRETPKVPSRRAQEVSNSGGAARKHRQARYASGKVEPLAEEGAPVSQHRSRQQYCKRLSSERYRRKGQRNADLRQQRGEQTESDHPERVQHAAVALGEVIDEHVGSSSHGVIPSDDLNKNARIL